MAVRSSALLCVLLVVVCAAAQQNPIIDQTQLPSTYVPSGMAIYKQYCAACHGADGKGRGPVAASLNTRPADLTTLAKHHDGKFPHDYVAGVLRFGPGFSAHGSRSYCTTLRKTIMKQAI